MGLKPRAGRNAEISPGRDPKLEDSFYASKIPALARKLCTERLTYAGQMADLVDAHLKPNYQYFGSLDKTLAGFYILDSTGDDYTLLDLREPNGPVYFQEHDAEYREVKLRYDSLTHYENKKRSRKKKIGGNRTPSTTRLWRRYLWISVLLCRSSGVDAELDATSTASWSFLNKCKNDEKAFLDVFERELSGLAKDPHLAIYWLLHFTLTCDDARRAIVVDAVKGSKTPLVRAFVDRFGSMKATETLKILPSFRRRRARFAFDTAVVCGKEPFKTLAYAYEMDSKIVTLGRTIKLVANARTDSERTHLTEIAKRNKDNNNPAAIYLRAAALKSANDATAFARLAAKSPEDLALYGEGLVSIAALVTDRKVLAGAKRALLAKDPYNRGYLNLAEGKPNKRLQELDSADALVQTLRTDATRYKQVDALSRPLKDRVTAQIMSEPDKFPLPVLRNALLHVFRYASRFYVIDQAMEWLEKRVKAGDAEAMDVLWAFVVTNDSLRSRNDVESLRRYSLRILRPAMPQEPLFSRMLAALEREGFLPEQLLGEFGDQSLLNQLSSDQREKIATKVRSLKSRRRQVQPLARWVLTVLSKKL